MIHNDAVSAESITRDLNTRIIGRSVFWFETVTSTNDVAKKMAQQNAASGTVIIAGEQTAGKGRLGRTWSSPRGTLALSVILRPDISMLHKLIMVASLAISHSIKKVTGLDAQIKWPNDVLINGKKISGILIENGWRGNVLDYAVIGIGVNVNFRPDDYSDIKETATSLSNESGNDISILTIARQLLVELDRLYLSGDSVFEEWRRNLITLGKEVRVTSGGMVNAGIAETVDRDGRLILRQANGSLLKISAGDVTLKS